MHHFTAGESTRRRVVALTVLGPVLGVMLAACGSSTTSASPTSSSGAAATAGNSTTSAPAGPSTSTPAGTASSSSGTTAAPGTASAAEATSAAAMGGMDALVAAAKKEGALNVIALPPDWANYGEMISAFQAKYPEIKVTSQQPDASSAQEITAADATKGTDQAPDVFDLGAAITLKSVSYFAPYQVASWSDIPAGNKESTGLWVNDYTGVMSVGYNADKYGDLTSLDQLSDPKFAGTVALNGNPTQANAALNGVVFAALAKGGSLDDISKGVDYFSGLKQAGTLSSVDPKTDTIVSGQVGVLFDWSYNQLGYANKLKDEDVTWKTFVPSGVALGAYYNQAISKDAPHPAAARLWEEFLYSAQGQNLWLKGGASPVMYQAMKAAGTVDAASEANLPKTDTAVVQLSSAQNTAVNDYLAAHWSAAIGS